ncbi:DUF3047 domain-containing protein [Marinobacter sp. CHS3-4]|uniref:DUF3047 domain-containing protein n=1 Tax=Marinobacter sp. CHS3-4 TaxID=3045174 RepID=UPI0024B58027|nr:DUF3047 domain-containing protein [Marinobacter sp. CHS3-4]MDI9243816.1 DUF3047 domain-containing protein [Marinobacter sp. CHS3-4]
MLLFLHPTPALTSDELFLAPFSTLQSLAPDWEVLKFPNIDRMTRYQLVQDSGQQVVKAWTDNSASGLIARVQIEPGDSLVLRWRWKVSSVYQEGNARSKDGDDYPARIYVAFEFEPNNASFFERAKRKAAALVFGEELPGNALNYIWANQLAKGTVMANAYTDTTQMIAVESGQSRVGQWVTEERDIVADYRQAFGSEPPRIVGVAIMSDSDNTGEAATAWYGDVELK